MTERETRHPQAEEEMEIDLRQMLVTLKKWKNLIIVGTLLCGLSAGLLSFFVMPPVYRAETLLMVTQATEKMQSVQQRQDLDQVVESITPLPVWTMNTYLGQIKSEAIMQRIIDKLELDPALYSPAGLSGMINASIVKDSNLLDITVTSGDPVLASRIANTLSEEYVQLMTDKNKQQMDRSMVFLEEQQVIADNGLQNAIDQLKAFQSKSRGVDMLQAELESISADKAEFSSRLKAVQVDIRQVSAAINSLERELLATPATITQEKWDESSGSVIPVQESNPLYSGISEQLAAKRAELAGKQGEREGLQSMVNSLSQQLDSLQSELAVKKVEEDKLQREVDRLKQTSETLAQKGTETQIARSIDLGDTSIMVISQASIPSHPIKPNKKMNTAIGLLLGMMLFTLLAFILDYLDNTLKRPEDISRELDLPVLGVIPLADRKNSSD